MGTGFFLFAAIPPAAVVLSFLVHWATLARVASAEERLPLCRGAYLAFSVQLALFAWALNWALAGADRHPALLLTALGMTLSLGGDFFNLQFPAVRRRLGEPLLFGVFCFAAAQACYIGAFLSKAPFEDLVARGYLLPLLAAFVLAPAFLFRFRVYDPARPKALMFAALGYGFVLGSMAAVAVAAAVAFGGAWILVAAGALSFLLSDAVMGETTIRGRHPKTEFQIPWLAYLAAQGLILLGFAFA